MKLRSLIIVLFLTAVVGVSVTQTVLEEMGKRGSEKAYLLAEADTGDSGITMTCNVCDDTGACVASTDEDECNFGTGCTDHTDCDSTIGSSGGPTCYWYCWDDGDGEDHCIEDSDFDGDCCALGYDDGSCLFESSDEGGTSDASGMQCCCPGGDSGDSGDSGEIAMYLDYNPNSYYKNKLTAQLIGDDDGPVCCNCDGDDDDDDDDEDDYQE